jgi:hypothetical protein
VSRVRIKEVRYAVMQNFQSRDSSRDLIALPLSSPWARLPVASTPISGLDLSKCGTEVELPREALRRHQLRRPRRVTGMVRTVHGSTGGIGAT